jgi:hypothetical protein
MESTKLTMVTFTQLYDMIDIDLSMGWSVLHKRKGDAKRWHESHERFHITLEFEGKEIIVNFYGPAEEPSPRRVLECMLFDARAVHEKKYTEVCNEYGYDPDNHESKKIFKACRKNKKKLMFLLGKNMFEKFMDCDMD